MVRLAKKYFHEAEYNQMREMILDSGRRLDGRSTTQVRPIYTEVDYLPAASNNCSSILPPKVTVVKD